MARTKQTARKVPIVDIPSSQETVQEPVQEQVIPERVEVEVGKISGVTTSRVKPLRKRLN